MLFAIMWMDYHLLKLPVRLDITTFPWLVLSLNGLVKRE